MPKVSKDIKKFIQSRGWYRENKTVAECLKQSKEATGDTKSEMLNLIKQKLNLQNQLVDLQTDPVKLKEYEVEHIKDIKELYLVKILPDNFREQVNNYLSEIDNPNTLIQDII